MKLLATVASTFPFLQQILFIGHHDADRAVHTNSILPIASIALNQPLIVPGVG